ncbi:hypothetical protein JYK00_05260 [Thermosipho ferrireducens]|uniref:Uncharacterized protein n=1 Tax=Thermosipho ferrireducens TaxID=2571116 RepID=A0ABX7S5T1_9BACT|nr:hypothetical protein [Thermosipho ferrireducens]QTA37161.1 hypothetical protein JYK00_05260 [Thermosipho ferrireducens]
MTNTENIELLLSKIPGIKAAKIIEENNTMKEIHIVADSNKSPKQLVRDIETVLLASTGIRIDRKIVSIAQLSSDVKLTKIVPYSLNSLKVEDIDSRTLKVSVTIEHGEEDLLGEAIGPKTKRNVPKVVGNAILSALNDIHDYALSLDDVAEIYLAGKRFIITHLTKEFNGEEESVIGAAELNGDYLKAVAESVLDAFRRI